MSTNILSIDEFMKYKHINKEPLPEILEFYNINKTKFSKTSNWRKPEQKQSENWLILNKFKQSDTEKLHAQFRSILNKLSDSNFNILAKEITELEIHCKEDLDKLVEFIFNKAIIETKFSISYARLSKELAGYCLTDNNTNVNVFFRELLIQRCQQMFNDCLIQTNDNVTKEKSTGCMTFIGELYNCELLTHKIINSCFLLLLLKFKQDKLYIIESIVALMKVVGKRFYSESPQDANLVFQKISKLIETPETLSNKEKFALMDLIDLRKDNNWI